MGVVRYTFARLVQWFRDLSVVPCESIFSRAAGAAGQAMPAKGSSLDDKIQQRLQARKQRGSNAYTPEVCLQHMQAFFIQHTT